MPATLDPLSQRLLGRLPVFWSGAYEVQAAVDVGVREMNRFRAAIDEVRSNYFPQTGSKFLFFYEELLRLSVASPEKTLEQRRTSILAFLAKLPDSSSGTEWEIRMSKLLGSGWSYKEHNVNDAGSPAQYIIELRLPYIRQISAPAQPTAVAASAGTLAAGTYYYAVTARNFYGETTASPVRSITVTANQRVTLDWPDVAGATSYIVYRGTSAGALGKTAVSTTSAYVDQGDAAGTTPPPQSNNSESFQSAEAKSLARQITPAHVDLVFTYQGGFVVGVSAVGDVLTNT